MALIDEQDLKLRGKIAAIRKEDHFHRPSTFDRSTLPLGSTFASIDDLDEMEANYIAQILRILKEVSPDFSQVSEEHGQVVPIDLRVSIHSNNEVDFGQHQDVGDARGSELCVCENRLVGHQGSCSTRMQPLYRTLLIMRSRRLFHNFRVPPSSIRPNTDTSRCGRQGRCWLGRLGGLGRMQRDVGGRGWGSSALRGVDAWEAADCGVAAARLDWLIFLCSGKEQACSSVLSLGRCRGPR